MACSKCVRKSSRFTFWSWYQSVLPPRHYIFHTQGVDLWSLSVSTFNNCFFTNSNLCFTQMMTVDAITHVLKYILNVCWCVWEKITVMHTLSKRILNIGTPKKLSNTLYKILLLLVVLWVYILDCVLLYMLCLTWILPCRDKLSVLLWIENIIELPENSLTKSVDTKSLESCPLWTPVAGIAL